VVRVAEEKVGVGPQLAAEAAALAKDAVDAAQRALECAARWRRKYRALKRRALARLRDVVAHLEAADGNDPRVRNALEILYDVVNDLEVSEE
jgi:hypothetical protein